CRGTGKESGIATASAGAAQSALPKNDRAAAAADRGAAASEPQPADRRTAARCREEALVAIPAPQPPFAPPAGDTVAIRWVGHRRDDRPMASGRAADPGRPGGRRRGGIAADVRRHCEQVTAGPSPERARVPRETIQTGAQLRDARGYDTAGAGAPRGCA